MTVDLTQTLNGWLLATADDQLILAHRDSEWTGHAPILEEDIALANIAQDELGHATLWYNLLTTLEGQDEEYPDRLVYGRGAAEWRNVQLVELPKGDWAFTMLRQYFMDAYEHVLMTRLEKSTNQDIANIAAKIHREELYHLKHSSAWVKRLALGTEESHQRTQAALEQQWPYVGQLFGLAPGEEQLVERGVIADLKALRTDWENLVLPMLSASQLTLPQTGSTELSRQQHTTHLDQLLDDLQKVSRLDPQAEW
jgi:ring-1,2-phenylacetyl-CoA epoxidase subunit PaaC